MLSKYFKFKIESQHFKTDFSKILEDANNKKILIFTNSEEFLYLDKIYKLTKKLNIAALVLTNSKAKTMKNKFSCPIVENSQIKNVLYDEILVLDSNAADVINKIKYHLIPDTDKIVTPFIEYVKEEKTNLIYLLNYNFDKNFPKLVKKMKNKTIILYGAGIFFQVIREYFDLSSLNIVGIVDKKYNDASMERNLYEYKLLHIDDILNIQPDYVIIMTKVYIPIWEGLYFNFLNKTKAKTKIIPIVKKNIIELLKDIIES